MSFAPFAKHILPTAAIVLLATGCPPEASIQEGSLTVRVQGVSPQAQTVWVFLTGPAHPSVEKEVFGEPAVVTFELLPPARYNLKAESYASDGSVLQQHTRGDVIVIANDRTTINMNFFKEDAGMDAGAQDTAASDSLQLEDSATRPDGVFLDSAQNDHGASSDAQSSDVNALIDAVGFDTAVVVDAGIADTTLPDTTLLDITTVDSLVPDTQTPDTWVADQRPFDGAAWTPDMATPDMATPDMATPDMATPDMATPDNSYSDSGQEDTGIDAGPGDATPRVNNSALIVAAEPEFMKISPDGSQVAFLTSYQDCRGTLVLANTDGTASSVLSTSASTDFVFSANSAYLAYVDDITCSSSQGDRDLWLIATSGGAAIQLGEKLDLWPQFHFTPDSDYLIFISDSIGYTGNLKMTSLDFVTTSTVETGASSFKLAPDGLAMAYTVNYNSSARSADLKLTSLPILAKRSIGSAVPTSYEAKCLRFTADSSTLFFVDSCNSSTAHCALKSISTSSGTPLTVASDIHLNALTNGPVCPKISTGGDRVIYWTDVSYQGSWAVGQAYWATSTGASVVDLGSGVVAGSISAFNSSWVNYIDNMDSSTVGEIKLYRHGDVSPILVDNQVYRRHLDAPNKNATTFIANYSNELKRGDFYILDLAQGLSTFIAADSNEWASYAPDSSKVAVLTNYRVFQDRVDIKIVNVPDGSAALDLDSAAYDSKVEFTPDSQKLFYVANYGSNLGDITLVGSDGSNPRVVVPDSHLVGTYYFSDSGRYAALNASTSSNYSSSYGVLTVVDLQSTNHTQVEPWVDWVKWIPATHQLLYFVPSGNRFGLWTATID